VEHSATGRSNAILSTFLLDKDMHIGALYGTCNHMKKHILKKKRRNIVKEEFSYTNKIT
jgi:hypothetical protein